MAKIKSEDLRLNIIVNGDAGRKKINDLTKSMRDSKAAMDDIQRKQGGLNFTIDTLALIRSALALNITVDWNFPKSTL